MRRKHTTRNFTWRELGLPALLALALLAGGGWWLLRAQPPRRVSPARPTPTMADDVTLRLGKIHLRGLTGGKITWEIEAENFDLARDRPLQRIDGVKKVALLHNGKQELALTAGVMERNTASGDITLDGGVTVSGKGIRLQTPSAQWDAVREQLLFPAQFTAHCGDFSLTNLGATSYDVITGTLNCTGGIALTMRGNTLRAQAARINVATQAFVLTGPVAAELDVAEMAAWTQGDRLPEIPVIPESIKQRYQQYCVEQTLPHGKGVRP